MSKFQLTVRETVPHRDNASRRNAMLCIFLGTDRKQRLVNYCGELNRSQRDVVCAMIDHCLNEGGA